MRGKMNKAGGGGKSRWRVAGDMPLAPKPPPYLQLREVRLLLPSPPQGGPCLCQTLRPDSGSSKWLPDESGWGQGPRWACSGLEGPQRHLWVPRECPDRRKLGEVPSSYAKEVSQGCGEGGT